MCDDLLKNIYPSNLLKRQNEVIKKLSVSNLGTSEIRVLLFVYCNMLEENSIQIPIVQSILCNQMNMSKSTVSKSINKLVGANILKPKEHGTYINYGFCDIDTWNI